MFVETKGQIGQSKVRLYSITCKLKEVYSNREAKCLRESLREFIL